MVQFTLSLQRNVIITQAVIERTPDDLLQEKLSSVQARHRRRRFEARHQQWLWDSCESEVFSAESIIDPKLEEVISPSTKQATLPIRIFRSSTEEKNIEKKKLENPNMYSILRFVNDDMQYIDDCEPDINPVKVLQNKTTKTNDNGFLSPPSTSSSAASVQRLACTEYSGERGSSGSGRPSTSSRAASFDSCMSSASSSRSCKCFGEIRHSIFMTDFILPVVVLFHLFAGNSVQQPTTRNNLSLSCTIKGHFCSGPF